MLFGENHNSQVCQYWNVTVHKQVETMLNGINVLVKTSELLDETSTDSLG